VNKPAFPRPMSEPFENRENPGMYAHASCQDGMSLLEYYAGQALTGLWAACAHPQSDAPTQCDFNIFAKACFEQAEAMIKEAEKRSKS